jgi:hypothetical protein
MRSSRPSLLSALSGIFGFTATPNQAVGAFRALRYDSFLEAGASPVAPISSRRT